MELLSCVLFNDLQEGIEGLSFNVQRYGAVGDGVTDDTEAIQDALDAAGEEVASDVYGATVSVPPGVYLISDQIIIPSAVSLVGSGSRVSVIRANADSFPSSTALVQLGAADSTAEHGMILRDLMICCNSVTGSIGVESTTVQEPGGLFNVIINRYKAQGVYIHVDGGNTPSHFTMDGCELFAGNGGAVGPSIELSGVANPTTIRRTTITANSLSDQRESAAIYATNGPLIVEAVNMERHDIGIDIHRGAGGNGVLTVIGVLAHPSLEKAINLNVNASATIIGLRSHATVAGIYDADGEVIVTEYDAMFYSIENGVPL
jgi:hypothetical protein